MQDRYYVTRHADGGFNVLDAHTGGPVEINGVLLYKIPDRETADELADALMYQAERVEELLLKALRGPTEIE